jgi:hypothetical protein
VCGYRNDRYTRYDPYEYKRKTLKKEQKMYKVKGRRRATKMARWEQEVWRRVVEHLRNSDGNAYTKWELRDMVVEDIETELMSRDFCDEYLMAYEECLIRLCSITPLSKIVKRLYAMNVIVPYVDDYNQTYYRWEVGTNFSKPDLTTKDRNDLQAWEEELELMGADARLWYDEDNNRFEWIEEEELEEAKKEHKK